MSENITLPLPTELASISENEQPKPSEAVTTNEIGVTVKASDNENPVKEDVIDKLAKEGLNSLIEKYLDDGVIDNNELIDIVRVTMEIVEKNKEISGTEKKKISLTVLRGFISDKVKDYDNLEKLFDKAIDLAVNVSKNGLESISFSKEMINDSKTAFNLIYVTVMGKVNEQYKTGEDIVNNIFDICYLVLQTIEGQTTLTLNEKKILLKKIVIKIINCLDTKISEDQKNFILSQIDPTLSLVEIAWNAKNGEFKINVEDVVQLGSCFSRLIQKCCKKKTASS